jgi:hypothetical protein
MEKPRDLNCRQATEKFDSFAAWIEQIALEDDRMQEHRGMLLGSECGIAYRVVGQVKR